MSRAHVLVNADVRTMDARRPHAEALAWRDGIIFAVGERDAVLHAAGDDAEVLDAHGATVLPGFIDAHQHPTITALYGSRARLTPPRVNDIASFQSALRAATKTVPPGRWVVATEWDELLLTERRPPTRAELDEAVPDHPLMAMHYTCHRALANSRALEHAGIGRKTSDPAGGLIPRGRDGLPDGLLIERAMSPVESLARADLVAHDADGFFEQLEAHHRALLAEGITRVVDATVPLDVIALYREAARRGRVLVPTVMLPVSLGGYLEAPWDVFSATLAHDTNGPLTIGPVKLVFDGAPVCAMCLSVWQTAGAFVGALALTLNQRSLDPVRASLSVRPRVGLDGKVRTGVTLYPREEAERVVRAAVDHGFTVAAHAIGNESIDVVLAAYKAAGPALHQTRAPRIEHATFLDRDLAARLAHEGVAVTAQPHMVTLPTVSGAPAVPGMRFMALRWLLDAGVKVAGSSDHPVTGFAPLDGIRAAVTRRTVGGRAYEPDQRIEIDEALVMYTRTAADVCGCLADCGTLEAGKRADLVVLDRALSAQTLDDVRVRATVLDGETVYGSAGAATRAT
jgi:predicted amidohydrolase YtcJ